MSIHEICLVNHPSSPYYILVSQLLSSDSFDEISLVKYVNPLLPQEPLCSIAHLCRQPGHQSFAPEAHPDFLGLPVFAGEVPRYLNPHDTPAGD